LNVNKITTAAEYICIQLYPDDLRGDFVRDIRVFYHADEIVYVLQALSTGMAGLFVGLITNYLYDKTKKPDQKTVDIEKLLIKQQTILRDLERLVAQEKDKDFSAIVQKHIATHKTTVLRIRDSDPYISDLIQTALSEIESRGSRGCSHSRLTIEIPARVFPLGPG